MTKKKTIDNLFEQADSRYALVSAISRKAREVAEDAEEKGDILIKKPVLIVIDDLLNDRAEIVHVTPEEVAAAETKKRNIAVSSDVVSEADDEEDFSEEEYEDDFSDEANEEEQSENF